MIPRRAVFDPAMVQRLRPIRRAGPAAGLLALGLTAAACGSGADVTDTARVAGPGDEFIRGGTCRHHGFLFP